MNYLEKEYFEKLLMFPPQEFFAASAGIKPVSRQELNPENSSKSKIKGFKAFCEENGLCCFVGAIKVFYGSPVSLKIMYISRDYNSCLEAYEAELNGSDSENRIKLAELLGYPHCCADFFVDKFSSISCCDSFVHKTYRNTKKFTEKSFYVNNIFNDNGRVGGQQTRQYQKFFLDKISKGYSNLFLSSHIPCSFDCKESIVLGEKIYKVMKEKDPKFADELIRVLSLPILFFNDHNWIVFKGFSKNSNLLRYDSVSELSLVSGLIKKDFSKFNSGNKLKITKNKISIFKDDRVIYGLDNKKLNGFLLNFA